MSIGALIAAAISLDELMDITNGPFSDIVTGIIEVASADLLQTGKSCTPALFAAPFNFNMGRKECTPALFAA